MEKRVVDPSTISGLIHQRIHPEVTKQSHSLLVPENQVLVYLALYSSEQAYLLAGEMLFERTPRKYCYSCPMVVISSIPSTRFQKDYSLAGPDDQFPLVAIPNAGGTRSFVNPSLCTLTEITADEGVATDH